MLISDGGAGEILSSFKFQRVGDGARSKEIQQNMQNTPLLAGSGQHNILKRYAEGPRNTASNTAIK